METIIMDHIAVILGLKGGRAACKVHDSELLPPCFDFQSPAGFHRIVGRFPASTFHVLAEAGTTTHPTGAPYA